MLFLATLLFLLLSPGMIITLPPTNMNPIAWFSNQTTSHIAVLVHAGLFYLVLRLAHSGTFPFNLLAEAEVYVTGENF